MSEAFYAVAEPRAASGEAYPRPEAFYWLLLWVFKKGSISHCLMAQPKNNIRGTGMSEAKQNYYGGLCTEMYEILHEKAPQDELDFYLSYAGKDKKILEPLCGNGRFLVPFMERGFDISGIDSSKEMLGKLKQKAPNAKAICADIREYSPQGHFDYIFISSGSVSLFTDMGLCKTILKALKEMLSPKGKLVFAVDTIANRCPDDSDYKLSLSVKTKEGFDLILKCIQMRLKIHPLASQEFRSVV